MSLGKVNALRNASRRLVRELGIVELDKSLAHLSTQTCHALVEIGGEPGIGVSKLAKVLLLSTSGASRFVHSMIQDELVMFKDAIDKREKALYLTQKGKEALETIDTFSNKKVEGAFRYLTDDEQSLIVHAIQKYAQALEQSREGVKDVKILTLSTSRPLRKQIVAMVENIQKNELKVDATPDLNAGIIRLEDEYYFNKSYNFWYATDSKGTIIGCVGLKKLDENNGEIKKFFIDKAYRGQQVAQKLLATLTKAAIKHGLSHLWLGTIGRPESSRFYTKEGFEAVDVKNLPLSYIKNRLDICFFHKKL